MGTQSGVVVSKANDPYTTSNNIPRPTPGPKQALLKTLGVALNPVESFMRAGVCVTEWPAVLGTDGCGVVIETGEGCTKFKKGDVVYGCVRVAQNSYSSFQDSFLADESLMLKKSTNLTVEDGCTIGTGLFTAALGLLAEGPIHMPKPGTVASEKDEWIVVIGGSGTVGRFAIQLGRLCGYKVLASCSPSKASIPRDQGANATFDHRASLEDQLSKIKEITGGKFGYMFDSSGMAHDLCIKALDTCAAVKDKYYSTVDDWSPHDNTPATITEYRIHLGELGRYHTDIGATISRQIAEWLPSWEAFLEQGILKPVDYQVLEGRTWDTVVEGIALLESGKAAKKLVVRVQDE